MMNPNLIISIMKMAEASSAERLVLVALAVRMNQATNECFPSVQTLSAMTGLSERMVWKVIRGLRDKGWLAVVGGRSAGNGGHPANSYAVSLPCTPCTDNPAQDAVQPCTPCMDNHTNPAQDAVQPCTPCIRSKKGNKKNSNTNRERFTPPTVDEVRAYCESRKNGIDAVQFVAHYESKGWKVGSSPMKNWQAAVITWERRNKSDSQNRPRNGFVMGQVLQDPNYKLPF